MWLWAVGYELLADGIIKRDDNNWALSYRLWAPGE